jgi:hypothetical protein
MLFERRQRGQHLEVGLRPLALLAAGRQLAVEHSVQSTGPLVRDAEDGEEQLVVADDVGEVAALHYAAGGCDISWPAGMRRAVEVERSQLQQLERRQILDGRLVPVHR